MSIRKIWDLVKKCFIILLDRVPNQGTQGVWNLGNFFYVVGRELKMLVTHALDVKLIKPDFILFAGIIYLRTHSFGLTLTGHALEP